MKPNRTESEIQRKIEQLEVSNKNLFALFESVPDAIIIHDLNGRVFAMNDAALGLSKISRDEMDRFSIFDIAFGYSDFNRVSDWWPDVLSGNRRECEWGFLDRDNHHKVTLQISMSPTVWNGNPAIVAVIRDFALQKKYEEELLTARQNSEESESKFRSLFEQASDGIFINDRDGSFLEVNQSGCKMLGYSRKELLELNIHDLVLKENLIRKPFYIDEMRSGNVVITERVLVRKDGSVFPVEISGSMFADGRMQGIVRDITERKKFETELIAAKEKAEENDRLKTAFLHNMSHEIRTPLNAIMGFADLLPEYFDDPERLRRYSELIRLRGADLIELIDDILDVAKIESGQLTSNPEKFNLGTFFADLDAIFNLFKSRINKSGVDFNFKVSSVLKAMHIEADQTRLKQILINLVENAFKFTDSGKIEIGCRLHEPEVLLFSVSDTGIGIPKEIHSSIFNRFTQAEQKTSQIYGGTGLGLSIVRGLLELMGGTIWLNSEVGTGSTFYFTIPFRKENVAEVQPVQNQLEISEGWPEVKILIVDDDYYSAEYLKEVIADCGFSSLHASTGQKAIDICFSELVDLVLMDIRLPDMTGYEAAIQIKKNNPNLKIIAQTAYVSAGEREKSLEAGCTDYVSKPIKRDLLLSKIQNVNKKVFKKL